MVRCCASKAITPRRLDCFPGGIVAETEKAAHGFTGGGGGAASLLGDPVGALARLVFGPVDPQFLRQPFQALGTRPYFRGKEFIARSTALVAGFGPVPEDASCVLLN